MIEATQDPLLRAFLDRAGIGAVESIEPLPRGGNNRIFRVRSADGEFALKQYYADPDDPRNRLAAEYAFCTFAHGCGLTQVPRPVACSPVERIGLYEFVRGRPLSAAEAGSAEVGQALEFLLRLNEHRGADGAEAIGPASEAFFSIDDQLGCVSRRVARLVATDAATAAERDSIDFARRRLSPAWEALRREVREVAAEQGVDCGRHVGQAERCLSPSDFGFHNVLREREGRLRFLDFEYAGWDDPAKTVSDFFCQPAIPAPQEDLPSFCRAVGRAVGDEPGLLGRVALLFPVFQIKWCCIILNGVLPTAARRRAFAAGRTHGEEFLERRLRDAQVALERLRVPGAALS